MTPTREQIEAEFDGFMEFPSEDKRHVTSVSATLFAEHVAALAYAAGREQGLREAREAFSLSEHMHDRNSSLMLCISDLSAVIVRMAAGIDHLSETARQWEPDHSSGADRRGWVLATEARDDALKLLKKHAAGTRAAAAMGGE